MQKAKLPQGYQESALGVLPKKWTGKHAMSFGDLSQIIQQTHQKTQSSAIKSVNRLATLRNWLIGYYIVEFEQFGNDRARYGEKLLERLEKKVDIKGLNATLFRNSRSFYRAYPQIAEIFHAPIHPTASDEFMTPASQLVEQLSFSHICEILTLEKPEERHFYETECIRGTWSVRELRRQIATNLYIRCGLSRSPAKLLAGARTTGHQIANEIREPFTFEFLGLSAKDVVSESDLEQSLIDHLQSFLLELGKGFCFESRQKRIIIDDRYYFADLVFYHRILHCHVIIELKNDEFKHEYLGQLNAYVSHYREHEMQNGDNPPVGILLCTRKGKKMVEYAIAGMDNHLFVSTYLLQLPDQKVLKAFLLRQMEGRE